MTATYSQPTLPGLPTFSQGAASPRTALLPVRVEIAGSAVGAAPAPHPAIIRVNRDRHGRFTRAAHAATDAVLAAVHTDHLPNRIASREAVRLAVHRVAEERDGRVHISWVRPLLPPWVTPCQIGAAVRMWTNAGHLAHTGEYLPNGDPSTDARNASKPAEIKRLVRHIPSELDA